MEKRYQVFVSSTFVDLQRERAEVVHALLELGCIPVGMELFPAASEDAWSFIRKIMEQCDYYMLVLAGRYGSVDPGSGVSFTEREYDLAFELKKPVIAFLHEDPGAILAVHTESDPALKAKLDAFRERVKKDRLCKFWKTADQLGAVVSRSYTQLISFHPAEGWVRGRFAADSNQLLEIGQLRTKVAELEAKLQRAKLSASTGRSELANLAKGQSKIAFDYRYVAGRDEADQLRYETGQVTTTWDRLLVMLSQALLTGCAAREVRATLEQGILNILSDDQREQVLVNPNGGQRFGVNLVYSSELNVLMQFLGLGWVRRFPKTPESWKGRYPLPTDTFWEVTEAGELEIARVLGSFDTETNSEN